METQRDMLRLDTGANGDASGLQPGSPDSRNGLAGCPILLNDGETTESETGMKHGEVTSDAGGFFSAPDWVFDVEDIDSHSKLTLLYLYRRSDKDYKCFPAMRRACSDLGCSKPRLLDSIKALEATGLLIVTRGKRADGGSAPNTYRLTIPCRKRKKGCVQNADTGGQPETRGEGQPDLPKGHTVGEGHTYKNPQPPAAGAGGSADGPAESSPAMKDTEQAPRKCVASPTLTKACDDVWFAAYGGRLSFGRLRKAFGRLVGEYADADIVDGFTRYCEETVAKYAAPESFVTKAGAWIEKSNGAPAGLETDDEWKKRAGW